MSLTPFVESFIFGTSSSNKAWSGFMDRLKIDSIDGIHRLPFFEAKHFLDYLGRKMTNWLVMGPAENSKTGCLPY